MLTNTSWIETPVWTEEDKLTTRIVFFRKIIRFKELPESYAVRISACSRYKLYINGTFVQYGPIKGDASVWFADELDLSTYLKKGDNCIAVSILCPPEVLSKGNFSTFRFGRARLFAEGFGTDGWKCFIERGTEIFQEEPYYSPLQIHEISIPDIKCVGWTNPAFDDRAWESAVESPRETLPETLLPENLAPRDIPFMQLSPHQFELPQQEIPANSECVFTLDAGEEMCAFLRLGLSGGKNAQIELLQSECYVLPEGKRNRLDSINGHLEGYADHYKVIGASNEVYEPYWFRTFRFLRISIQTADEPLTLRFLDYEETGYPLEIKTTIQTSDESLSAIWDICARTLRRCMQETYTDCPFYEQLQFIMDTRAQILFTYTSAADDRLARRAIDDFSRARRPDGLLNCNYPNVNEFVIPGFAVFYIMMVYDHMMHFGDKELVQKNLPVIDGILSFFQSHLTADGIVDQIGGVIGVDPLWSFIDWAEEWMASKGVPTAGLFGPMTMESLLYLLGMQLSVALCAWIGNPKETEYQQRADALAKAIRNTCMNADGLLVDGPGREEKSQHCQVFGVLTNVLNPDEGRRAMERCMSEPGFTHCTVSMAYYLFRALEKTGLYALTDGCWDIWREMIRNGCTTCIETDKKPRSECHAWGALALYELPSAILGVRPAAPGYETIEVSPVPGYLTSASGTVHTPHGDVTVSWKQENGKLKTEIDCLPEVFSRIKADAKQ
ncbi:MAG: hypothetical protein IKZ95_06730 [Lachnospiraceae bacterium]|nr:hypothetical protein [Lachnospiraceae bacterium]